MAESIARIYRRTLLLLMHLKISSQPRKVKLSVNADTTNYRKWLITEFIPKVKQKLEV